MFPDKEAIDKRYLCRWIKASWLVQLSHDETAPEQRVFCDGSDKVVCANKPCPHWELKASQVWWGMSLGGGGRRMTRTLSFIVRPCLKRRAGKKFHSCGFHHWSHGDKTGALTPASSHSPLAASSCLGWRCCAQPLWPCGASRLAPLKSSNGPRSAGPPRLPIYFAGF